MKLEAKLLICPDTEDEMGKIIDQWNLLGVRTVYLLAQQIERRHAAESLKRFSGDVWIVVQTLLNREDQFPAAVTADGSPAKGSGDGSWLTMLCPRGKNRSGVSIAEYRAGQIRDLCRKHRPFGISLDFIRHFVFWEEVYADTPADDLPRSCFCPECISAFSEAYSLKLPEESSSAIAEILSRYISEWEQFAENTITDLVGTLAAAAKSADPAVQINLHAVPWRSDEYDGARSKRAGQNLRALAPYLNRVSPMCYSPMLKRPISWIAEITEAVQKECGLPVVPALQICPMYGTPELTEDEFREMVTAAGENSAGVVIWPWERVTEKQIQTLASLAGK